MSSTKVIEAMLRMRRALANAARAYLPRDVTLRQATVLIRLRIRGPAAQVGLARVVAADAAGIARLVDALQRRGWVERTRSRTDRREKLVALTARGRRALEPIDRAFGILERHATEGLSRDEEKQFLRVAERLATSLSASAVGSAPAPTSHQRVSGERRGDFEQRQAARPGSRRTHANNRAEL